MDSVLRRSLPGTGLAQPVGPADRAGEPIVIHASAAATVGNTPALFGDA